MTVTGKHVFALKQLMARQASKSPKSHGPGRGGKRGLTSIRGSHRIHKPSKINKWS